LFFRKGLVIAFPRLGLNLDTPVSTSRVAEIKEVYYHICPSLHPFFLRAGIESRSSPVSTVILSYIPIKNRTFPAIMVQACYSYILEAEAGEVSLRQHSKTLSQKNKKQKQTKLMEIIKSSL
jgi:hypothetical protein